jgi:hypothetical protein
MKNLSREQILLIFKKVTLKISGLEVTSAAKYHDRNFLLDVYELFMLVGALDAFLPGRTALDGQLLDDVADAELLLGCGDQPSDLDFDAVVVSFGDVDELGGRAEVCCHCNVKDRSEGENDDHVLHLSGFLTFFATNLRLIRDYLGDGS